jgi:hypothetical protein
VPRRSVYGISSIDAKLGYSTVAVNKLDVGPVPVFVLGFLPANKQLIRAWLTRPGSTPFLTKKR